MKRSAISTPSKKRPKTTALKKGTRRTFYAVPRPMVQYASGFPKQLKITHKFTQSNWLTYSGPNLNCVWYSYGVNCLYDPVLAVGGTQPMYFDQLSDIYNHYTVVASRIKVTIIPNRTEAFTGGIVIDDDGTPSVTHLDMITQQTKCCLQHIPSGCVCYETL